LRHSGLVHFEVNGKLFIFKIPVSGPDFQNTVELPQSRISRTPYPPIGGPRCLRDPNFSPVNT